MSKQTFSIFQIFALYFPFCMRPYDARSSVTLERLGFVVREPQSHLELTYFLPKISAFMLISGNWANVTLLQTTLPKNTTFREIRFEIPYAN